MEWDADGGAGVPELARVALARLERILRVQYYSARTRSSPSTWVS